MLENFVVVPEGEEYAKGNGYKGPLLRELGFPEGPYTQGVAKILIRQLASLNPKAKFKIVEYKKQ
jgi:hypothetical protein